MKTEFSIQDILDLKPCESYDEIRLKELFGEREKCTVEEILDFPISDNDKTWFIGKVGLSCCFSERGYESWYKNGKLHRDDDKPAIEFKDGTKEWYQNGKLHRDGDKPAIEYPDGTKEWYKNGELYRDSDKPVIEESDGAKYWFQNGNLHRDGDKPAIEDSDGIKKWYLNGKFIRKEIKQ